MADYKLPMSDGMAPNTQLPLSNPNMYNTSANTPKVNISSPPKPSNIPVAKSAEYKAPSTVKPPMTNTSSSMGSQATYKPVPKMEAVDEDNIDVADSTDVGDDSSAASYSSNENEVTQEMGIISSVIAITLLTPIFVAGVTITGISICSHFNNKSLCKRFNEVTGKKTTMKDIDKYCLDASGYINEFAVNNVKPFINKMCVTGTTPELDTNHTFIGVKNEDDNRVFTDYKHTNINDIFFINTDIGFIYDKDKYSDDTIENKIANLSKDDFYVSAYIPLNDYDEYENGMADTIKRMNKYGVAHISIMLPITKFFDRIKTKVTQEAVNNIIKNSPNLITALESVGAMYCIPSTHFTCDNSLKSIRVVGDCVNAPDIKNVSGNGKAIMCAIGSVLDYISKRIDDKLDAYHHNIIDTARRSEVEKFSKPIIPVAQNTYFNDMDDITSGMDDNVVDNEISEDNGVDMASEIQESAQLFEMYASHGCTRNLGYEIMQEQGFDYVQPTNTIITESAKKASSKKPVMLSDIKYLKFDNKNIIDAIKYFNKARAEQSENEVGKLDIKKLINSDSYNKAINSLNKQFNAHLQLRFFKTDNPTESNEFTWVFDDIKNNLTLSKAKGFQLGGLPIIIGIIGDMLDKDAPNDISLFGQNVVSVILHEIFHNIVSVITQTNNEFNTALNATLSIASTLKTGKEKRIFLSNYVNTLDNFFGIKMNRFIRRRLVKHLAILTSVMCNDAAVNAIKNDIKNSSSEEEADKLITYYENIIKYKTRKKASYKKGIISGAIAAIFTISTIVFNGLIGKNNKFDNLFSKAMTGSVIISLSFAYSSLFNFTNTALDNAIVKSYKNGREMEEYYCDLFAAMYNLPVTWMHNFYDGKKGFVENQIDTNRLNKLVKLEREIYELLWSTYPTTFERNHASVKIAKNVLESGEKLDPSIKKYLEWIVDNYSSLLDTNIDEIYNTTTFDPKEADDLDKHLDNLITNNNITLTESYINKILNVDEVISD